MSSEEGAGQAAGGLVLRTVATLAAPALWFWTQSLIVTANSEPVAYGWLARSSFPPLSAIL